ncbi:MAG TPA: hypothetical protein VJM31_11295 [Vicinamibacterales bacterium]|nr:hypothetical protein [Vicinamibacterales bacterium]
MTSSERLVLKIVGISAGLLIVVGGFVIFQLPTETSSPQAQNIDPGSDATHASPDEMQYLIIVTSLEETIFETSDSTIFSELETNVLDLVNKVGARGDGKSRRLGFMILIPPWLVEKGAPGRIERVIREAFNVAKKHDVAVYFSLESHFIWDSRPDLWNWFDPRMAGYNEANKQNVEWSDWEGTPNRSRFALQLWGQTLKPHMCYNSPKIKSEITRIVSTLVAPSIKTGIDYLRKEGKAYLFAGITLTSELSLDNYESLDRVGTDFGKRLESTGIPKTMLGFCALTNLGYSKSHPPKNYPEALAKINQEFSSYWAKQFVESGIDSSKLYSHVAAGADEPGSEMLKYTNAPIWTAIHPYSRPGWTTYPEGPLKKDFDAIYTELAKNNIRHWGGVEASPWSLSGDVKIPPEKFLARHFNHGATVLVMNAESSGAPMVAGIWTKDAIKAYRKFLAGEELSE